MAVVSEAPRENWTIAGDYAPLAGLDRSGFAWEWLRRRPDYEEAAAQSPARAEWLEGRSDPNARAWHLHCFEKPALSAIDARPIWRREAYKWVLKAVASTVRPSSDSFELESLSSLVTLVRSKQFQHLLLSDGLHSVRLDVSGSDLFQGPTLLTFTLAGLQSLDRPLTILRQLRFVVARHRFAVALYPRFDRAKRMIQLLRTFDALKAGATQADITDVLLQPGFERKTWRIRASSQRSQAQRLVRGARALSANYARLLG